MTRIALPFFLLLLPACSDQHLVGLGGGSHETVPEDPVLPDGPDDPIEDADPVEDDEEPAPTCATWLAPEWAWTGSQPFTDMSDLTDSAGVPFWDPAFTPTDWSGVLLPDTGPIPVGSDRAYRGVATLDELPPGLLELSVESDDGLWLWVNGTFVGHWGGDWQQEGCVNEDAGCLDSVHVEAQDVTDLLVGGENLIAARVSNPVMDAWFEVEADCVDW